MHAPISSLKVFLSGVSKEFSSPKKGLKQKLGEHHVTEVYCNEDDSEPDFCETWPRLENKITTAQIFVLFLGSKFGTPTDTPSISITQKEYETAKSLKKAIIVLRQETKTEPFENTHQEEFYNKVINFDKDQIWAPHVNEKYLGDSEKLASYILKYAHSIAAECIPVVNDESEAGNFYVKISFYNKPVANEIDPTKEGYDEVTIRMSLCIQNRDEHEHLITSIWFELFGEKWEARVYNEDHYERGISIKGVPINIAPRGKRVLRTTIRVRTPKGQGQKFIDDLRSSENTKSFLPLKFNSI